MVTMVPLNTILEVGCKISDKAVAIAPMHETIAF